MRKITSKLGPADIEKGTRSHVCVCVCVSAASPSLRPRLLVHADCKSVVPFPLGWLE